MLSRRVMRAGLWNCQKSCATVDADGIDALDLCKGMHGNLQDLDHLTSCSTLQCYSSAVQLWQYSVVPPSASGSASASIVHGASGATSKR